VFAVAVPIHVTLKIWRVTGKLTREVVATAAKVTGRTVENWERGVGEPGIEQLRTLEKLAPGLLAVLGLRGRK